MTMILQLLVAAVAVGLSAADAPPPYKEHVQAMQQALKTLEKNVLSMEGNIPLLNDSRRHYAEIIHVVHHLGHYRSGCLNINYYDDYYPQLNISAPESISTPQLVLDQINYLHQKVHKGIAELKELIDTCTEKSEVCNALIEDTVKMNPDQFKHPSNVLIAAGDVATTLNDLNDKIEQVSSDMSAHQFVTTSPGDLKNFVDNAAQLYRSLNPYPRLC